MAYNAVGQVLTYNYTITNTGNVTLPGPFTVSDNKIGIPVGTPFTCGAGPVPPNGTTSCTASYVIVQADIDAGAVTNTATASTSYTDAGGNTTTPTSDSTSATANVNLESTSALTHSASKSTSEISNQLVTDFEILLNGQNVIAATNPGQFFYHQWATNPYSIATSWSFELNWTDKFETQTSDGDPIKAFIQMPGSGSITQWTQVSGICWKTANGCPANVGRITVNNVPAGATVWVMAHIDFKPKGSNISTLSPNPVQKPVIYGPLSSTITIRNNANAIVGSSYSSTSVIGRGKKVTMVYGTATDATGAAMADTWIQVKQGNNSAMTKTDSQGFYVFFDGQSCAASDGIFGACAGAWTSTLGFASGNSNSTLSIYGQGGSPSGTPTFPGTWTKAEVRTSGQSSPLATITTPTYSFSVKNGDAHERNLKFRN